MKVQSSVLITSLLLSFLIEMVLGHTHLIAPKSRVMQSGTHNKNDPIGGGGTTWPIIQGRPPISAPMCRFQGKNPPTRIQGSEIHVEYEVSAWHKGTHGIKLELCCQQPATEQCLRRGLIKTVLKTPNGNGIHQFTVPIPSGKSGICVFRAEYVADNNWHTGDGGKQEVYRNCADIEIGGAGGAAPTNGHTAGNGATTGSSHSKCRRHSSAGSQSGGGGNYWNPPRHWG